MTRYIAREKAERICASTEAGLKEIANHLHERLSRLVPTLAGESDQGKNVAMLRRETDRAIAEVEALRQMLIEQLDATEH